jgi:hypothetical protein
MSGINRWAFNLSTFPQIFYCCTASPRVKILSNPRRIHSEEEDEEKEEQGLPRAPVCCSTTFPSPSPSPPTHAARLLGCLGPRYQDTSPPLPPL